MLLRLSDYLNNEQYEVARAILQRQNSSSFECLLRETPDIYRPHASEDKKIFEKAINLAQVLNVLLNKGLLKAEVALVNNVETYVLFYPSTFK